MLTGIAHVCGGAGAGSRHAERLPAHHRRPVVHPLPAQRDGHAPDFGTRVAQGEGHGGRIAIVCRRERQQQQLSRVRVGVATHRIAQRLKCLGAGGVLARRTAEQRFHAPCGTGADLRG